MKSKTARFSQVVAEHGHPYIYLALSAPERDTTLKRFLRAHRVMTIHQPLRGGGADYGTVGMLKAGRAQLLVFPRSLKELSGRRIVGINYDLLEASPGPRAKPATRNVPHSQPSGKPPAAPEAKKSEIVAFPSAPPTWEQVLTVLEATQRLLARRKTNRAAQTLRALIDQISTHPDLVE